MISKKEEIETHFDRVVFDFMLSPECSLFSECAVGGGGAKTIPVELLENYKKSVKWRVTNFRSVSHHVSLYSHKRLKKHKRKSSEFSL